MAMTRAKLAALRASRVDAKTVQPGDRVKHGRSVGTVVKVSADRVNGYGEIQWDGDAASVESALRAWGMLKKG